MKVWKVVLYVRDDGLPAGHLSAKEIRLIFESRQLVNGVIQKVEEIQELEIALP